MCFLPDEMAELGFTPLTDQQISEYIENTGGFEDTGCKRRWIVDPLQEPHGIIRKKGVWHDVKPVPYVTFTQPDPIYTPTQIEYAGHRKFTMSKCRNQVHQFRKTADHCYTHAFMTPSVIAKDYDEVIFFLWSYHEVTKQRAFCNLVVLRRMVPQPVKRPLPNFNGWKAYIIGNNMEAIRFSYGRTVTDFFEEHGFEVEFQQPQEHRMRIP